MENCALGVCNISAYLIRFIDWIFYISMSSKKYDVETVTVKEIFS